MRMTKKSTTVTAPSLLVEEWVERTPLSWRQLAGAVSLVLVSFLLIAAYLDGVPAEAFNLGFWRSAAMFPGVVTYILLTQPAGRQFRDDAIKALRPLVPLDDDEFCRLVAQEPIFNRRRQGLALAIGAATVLLFRPWESLPSWLTLYQILGGVVMFGLLGWLVYTSLAATSLGVDWELSEDINVFELQRLEPIARWSLSNTLFYIGGITLSLLFTGRFTLDIGNVIIYGVLTAAAVLVFFTNMRSTHRLMVQAKNRELERVRENLAAASRALRERAATGKMEDIGTLRDYIETWVGYEERVAKVPEWPYTTEIRRNLVVSLLVPLAAYIVPALLLEAVRQLMSL
jgi:hypothetical protein